MWFPWSLDGSWLNSMGLSMDVAWFLVDFHCMFNGFAKFLVKTHVVSLVLGWFLCESHGFFNGCCMVDGSCLNSMGCSMAVAWFLVEFHGLSMVLHGSWLKFMWFPRFLHGSCLD